ncbi:hypothetical protein ACFQU7_08965 [Pseudoroseomonas wenyumeiae]
MRLGTLGFPYTALATPDASTRGWSFTPSLGLELEATDNLYATRRNRKADFITRLQPGLLFTVDTARLQGVFNYQPELELHAAQGSQNGIDHFLNGQLLLTVVPNAVYVDLRGSAGVQAAGGGYAPPLEKRAAAERTMFRPAASRYRPMWCTASAAPPRCRLATRCSMSRRACRTAPMSR